MYFKLTIRRVAILLLPWLLLSGCASDGPPPGNVNPVAERAVDVDYVSLKYKDGALGTVSKSGLSLSAAAQPVASSLKYRYSLTSRVNGDYFLMPDPPTIYTILKTPVSETAPDRISFSIDIRNRSETVLLPERAIAALDVNDTTIFEKDILLPRVLPRHHASVTIDGPLLRTAPHLPASGTMRLGIYRIKVGGAERSFSWETEYVLTRRSEKLPVEVVLKTAHEKEARQALKVLRARQGTKPELPEATGTPDAGTHRRIWKQTSLRRDKRANSA